MSQFELGTLSLKLERFPQQRNSTTLCAWEAADEYLLQHIDKKRLSGRPVILFNDRFGALACALHGCHLFSISDSYLSHMAAAHNLSLNDLDADVVTLLSGLDALPEAPILVIIKIPKTLALLAHQLTTLRNVVSTDTLIIASAKTKDIHNTTLQLFERILGPIYTSLAWRKARLIHCKSAVLALPLPYVPDELTIWPLDGTDYLIHNYGGVFSHASLDTGTRFFMEHLPDNLIGKVVDLGCGNGVTGIKILEKNRLAQVLFTDESYMAVASSKLNVLHNRPQDLTRCEFMVNDSLAGIKPDSLVAVLCNPPFHQQHEITDRIAWQMFCDAKRCLKTGGELRIVGNRHLDYFHKLKSLFGNCATVASNKKFMILRAIKADT